MAKTLAKSFKTQSFSSKLALQIRLVAFANFIRILSKTHLLYLIFLSNKLSITTTIEKMSVPNKRTASAASFWTNLGMLQTKNNLDCNQSVFSQIKKVSTLIEEEHFKPKLTIHWFNWLPKQLQINVSSFFFSEAYSRLDFKSFWFN